MCGCLYSQLIVVASQAITPLYIHRKGVPGYTAYTVYMNTLTYSKILAVLRYVIWQLPVKCVVPVIGRVAQYPARKDTCDSINKLNVISICVEGFAQCSYIFVAVQYIVHHEIYYYLLFEGVYVVRCVIYTERCF